MYLPYLIIFLYNGSTYCFNTNKYSGQTPVEVGVLFTGGFNKS